MVLLFCLLGRLHCEEVALPHESPEWLLFLPLAHRRGGEARHPRAEESGEACSWREGSEGEQK